MPIELMNPLTLKGHGNLMVDSPNGVLEYHSNAPSHGEFFPEIFTNDGNSDDNFAQEAHFTILPKNARVNSNNRLVHVLVELENEVWDVILF